QVPGLPAVDGLVDPALTAGSDREDLRDVGAVGFDVAEGQRLLGVGADVLPGLAAVGGPPDAAFVAGDPGDLGVDGVEAAQALVRVGEVDPFPAQPRCGGSGLGRGGGRDGGHGQYDGG